MAFKNNVTEIAAHLYPQIYTDTSTLKIADKEKIQIGDGCADRLCKEWQSLAKKIPNLEHISEANVAGNSPIDLLDLSQGIAYELKYSQKNVKHEFYKDLFKVLIYNQDEANKIKIKQFVFLCHHQGIGSLIRSSLCVATIQFMQKNGIEVELVELFPAEKNKSNAA